MYTVRPYFECAVAPEPAEVLYPVPSYHNEELKKDVRFDNLAGVVKEAKLDKIKNDDALVDRIHKKQLDLIDELNALIGHLKIILTPESDLKSSLVISAKKKPVKPKKKFASRSGEYARKEATKLEIRDGIVRYNLTNRPCAISVVTTNADRNCLLYLSKIGQKEAVVFSGIEDIQCGDHETKSLVNVKISADDGTLVMAGINGAKVRGRVGVWKLLGALVGVYPTARAAKTATHIDRWLFLADAMLVGKRDEATMPFKLGAVPLRRTFLYLQQGTIKFRDSVKVFTIGYSKSKHKVDRGAYEFIFWHWAQLQHNNPYVQLVRYVNVCSHPFAKAYLEDGREVLFDLEDKSREEIEVVIRGTLGKTIISRRREELEQMLTANRALFGKNCARECICEVQGQHPCTSLVCAPDYLKGKWRWNHNLQ